MSRDKLRCMPPPLSALCALHDRAVRRGAEPPALAYALHDKALRAWCQVRWIAHRLDAVVRQEDR
ncbi:hypothetical protein GCM10023196_035840 [Actinoallomurus vinaceus]|uniref:Uncharacterized protein n=1 Tax=Actinoallomurus vinaceus TaxID=1080074 RepID=A0ABP8UDI9_9ACTN